MSTLSLILTLLLACETTPNEHGDEHGDEGGEHQEEVHLSPEALKAASLSLTPATEGTLSRELTLPARVALDPRKEAVVSTWISGQVGSISVRAGDQVSKGQALASVQSPDLGEAIASYRAAVAQDDAASSRLQRLERLEQDGVSSKAQVLDAQALAAEATGSLEAAEERLRVMGVNSLSGDPRKGEHYPSKVPVRAPISGTVLSANATVGLQVAPGQELFHIGDLDEVWLLLDIFESDLSLVATGQSLDFVTPAWPDQVFTGVVDQVGSVVDPQDRTIEVRVIVDNPQGKLMPNMFATATLTLSEPGQDGVKGVLVPTSALREMEGHPVIFVEGHEAGEFEARSVTVIAQNSSQAMVQGLTAGEAVVSAGAFTLQSELEKSELGEGHAH